MPNSRETLAIEERARGRPCSTASSFEEAEVYVESEPSLREREPLRVIDEYEGADKEPRIAMKA